MSHDFEPTEAEKEMLSHIKDIVVNRKQSELGNIISGAILDGQNQIHDLYKEKATAQEVEYRMRRSYTYWMNKLHQELQKAREERKGWKGYVVVDPKADNYKYSPIYMDRREATLWLAENGDDDLEVAEVDILLADQSELDQPESVA